MNRKEFLAQLSRLLWDIPEADRKDALEYYENYLRMQGKKTNPLSYRNWEVRGRWQPS